jgi:PKD repeat protein
MKKLIPILLLLTCFQTYSQDIGKQTIQYTFPNNSTNEPNEIESSINGFTKVLKNNKFSFVNTSGKLISPYLFDGVRYFSNHLAAVCKNERWGFINQSGLLIIPCEYDLVYDFSTENTIVSKNKLWFLINKKGQIVKQLDIDVCRGYLNGFAQIEKGNKKGYLNRDGTIILNEELPIKVSERNYFSSTNNLAADCPNNLGFENGSFTNWNCYIGSVDSVGQTNVITLNPSAPTANRHTLIPRATPSALDPYGLFPTNPPDGSNFCVKLGNTRVGAEAEGIRYKINVPLSDSNFSIIYDYAVVFQDPGHTNWTQPRFTAKIKDSATNSYIDCATFEYISTSNLPGFQHSTVHYSTADTAVIYKPWSSVFISLRSYIGRTLYLEFTNADCVRRGHWGYAYVDVENSCGKPITVEYDCNYPHITHLNGPSGFQNYNWWNNNYSAILATGQHAVLNPGPALNTQLWLEMIPFNSFGCRDTLAVNITGSFTPTFDISENSAYCAPHNFTFYNTSLPSSQTTWNFGDGNTAAGDTVNHVYQNPGTYIVTMTVLLPGGCIGTTRDTITIIQPNPRLNYISGSFCNSQSVQFNASSTGATNYHWEFGDGSSITTNNAQIVHNYNLPGTYIPQLTINYSGNCQYNLTGTDTIKIENINPAFTYTVQKNCSASVVNFINQSTSQFGITNAIWNFGDGTTGSGNVVSHTYTTTGNFRVKLLLIGSTGCLDSLIRTINIIIAYPPRSFITSLAAVCQNTPVIFAGHINSLDSITSMSWTTSDGQTTTGDSASFTFSQPGTFNVNFYITTIFGCRDTSTRQIIIKPTPVFTTPNNQFICNGAQTSLISLNSNTPGTSFNWTNNNPSIGLGASGHGNIPSFTAINNTSTNITANITVSSIASGCEYISPGFSITVFPTPQSIQPANQVLCNNTMTEAVALNNSALISYTWSNNTPSIGLASNGTGNINSFNAINNSTSSITATITLIATANNCNSLPQTFTITVNPDAVLDSIPDHFFCNGTITNSISITGPVAGTRFSWTNDNPSIGLSSSGTGDIPSFVATTNSFSPNVGVVNVFGTSGNNCQTAIKVFKIFVNPNPLVEAGNNLNVCRGSNVSLLANGAASYSWSPSLGLNCSNCSNPQLNAIDTITYYVEGTDNNGCKNRDSVVVSVIQPFNMMVSPNDSTCFGKSIHLKAMNASHYQWSPPTGLNDPTSAEPIA